MRILLFVLLLPCSLYAQPITIGGRPSDLEVLQARKTLAQLEKAPSGTVTVGSQYSTPEVTQARDLLASVEPKSLIIRVGEFEVIEPHKTVTAPLLWVVQDDTLLERITVNKDQPFGLWLTRRGESGPKLHLFAAKPFPWAILVAKRDGAGSIQIVRNGDSLDKPPVIIDRIDAVVGTPKPPTPPPVKPDNPQPEPPTPGVDTALVKELKDLLAKDKASALADWKYAGIWAQSFIDGSKLLKLNDPAIAPKTLADLYAKHKAAWMADDVPVLPFLTQTRQRVAKLIEQELGTDPQAALDRNKASELYSRLGTALLEALK